MTEEEEQWGYQITCGHVEFELPVGSPMGGSIVTRNLMRVSGLMCRFGHSLAYKIRVL